MDALLARVAPAVRAVLAPGDSLDDVMQSVRERVLIGAPDRPPQIGSYEGRGELRLWLRVIAVRTALGLRRDHRRELAASDAAALYVPGLASDPALEQAKQTYQIEFAEAFAEALAAMSERERSLLAQQFVDGLGVGEIAAVYSIHRDTAARWLSRARAKLYAATRRGLMSRLHIDRSEFDSILRLIRSRLDVTFRDLLGGG